MALLGLAGVFASFSPDEAPPAPRSQVTEGPVADGGTCNIKGNVSSSGERIYHLPGQRYYNETRISSGKGERYFCSEAEALAAGWRRSKV